MSTPGRTSENTPWMLAATVDGATPRTSWPRRDVDIHLVGGLSACAFSNSMRASLPLRTAFALAFSAARAREGHRRSPHRTSGHMPPRVSRCKGGNIGDSRGCHISATRSSTAAAARSRCPAMCLLCRTTPKCQRCSPQHRCTKRFIRPSRPVCSNQYLYRRMMASVVACEWHA